MELRCGLKRVEILRQKKGTKIIPKRIGYHGTGICFTPYRHRIDLHFTYLQSTSTSVMSMGYIHVGSKS